MDGSSEYYIFKSYILWEDADIRFMAESKAEITVTMAYNMSHHQGEDWRAYWNPLGNCPLLPRPP